MIPKMTSLVSDGAKYARCGKSQLSALASAKISFVAEHGAVAFVALFQYLNTLIDPYVSARELLHEKSPPKKIS